MPLPRTPRRVAVPLRRPQGWLAAKNVALRVVAVRRKGGAPPPDEGVRERLEPPCPTEARRRADDGSGPREDVEWVIDMPAGHDGVLKRAQVLSILDGDWLDKNERPTLYGRAVADKRWTRHRRGARLIRTTSSRLASARAARRPLRLRIPLAQIERTAEDAAKRLGASGAKARSSAHAALEGARSLEAIGQEVRRRQSGGPPRCPRRGRRSTGKKVWDVMMSLGLHWGNMDEFHWENDAHASGDDHLFSVSTSMNPGYFLPRK